MNKSVIIKDPRTVGSELNRFGVEQHELIQVAQKVVLAKNESVLMDPINAPGLLAYIYGTRAIRELLLPKGWVIDRTDNVEATVHPESGIVLVFQNTDCAAIASREPKAISGKGAAAERLVAEGTRYLFEEFEQEYLARLNSSVWYFCVAVNETDEETLVQAELSCPISIEGNQFNGFSKRIFILNESTPGDDDFNQFDDGDDDISDIDIDVTPKI